MDDQQNIYLDINRIDIGRSTHFSGKSAHNSNFSGDSRILNEATQAILEFERYNENL
jgi:hypothetical protein